MTVPLPDRRIRTGSPRPMWMASEHDVRPDWNILAGGSAPAPRQPAENEAMRRVVVTGLGVVAPNGIGKEAFWSACLNGRSGVGPIRTFDASQHPVQVAAEVADFDVTPFVPDSHVTRTQQGLQLLLDPHNQAIVEIRPDRRALHIRIHPRKRRRHDQPRSLIQSAGSSIILSDNLPLCLNKIAIPQPPASHLGPHVVQPNDEEDDQGAIEIALTIGLARSRRGCRM